MADVQPKFDFSGIDPAAIDPDRLDFGTDIQDCSTIANTFERGAHATATEAAVFATLSRSVQNGKHLALTTADSLTAYLRSPQESAQSSVDQAQSFDSEFSQGESTQTEHSLQSLNVGTQQQSTFGSNFGKELLEVAKECIPCDLRLLTFLELHPSINLLEELEAHLLNQLGFLQGVTDLLNNFDSYGGFCELLNLLSFMCLPDIQRMITTLMAMLILEVPQLDGMIGNLQALIIPLFAPILMAITTLFDQFSLLVTNPLACVLDAINLQLSKLGYELDPASPVAQASMSLSQLQDMLSNAKLQVEAKLDFYIGQVKAMLGELGGGDSAYLSLQLSKLRTVRMVAFLVAVITARTQGHAACSTKKAPELDEINNFFNNFLNPNAPFDLWVDEHGQLRIDEHVEGFDDAVAPLSDIENVFQFEGEPVLDASAIQAAQTTAASLAETTYTVAPCRLETSVSDVEKVNQWIEELNKSS
jgi:hypothetical protein